MLNIVLNVGIGVCMTLISCNVWVMVLDSDAYIKKRIVLSTCLLQFYPLPRLDAFSKPIHTRNCFRHIHRNVNIHARTIRKFGETQETLLLFVFCCLARVGGWHYTTTSLPRVCLDYKLVHLKQSALGRVAQG